MGFPVLPLAGKRAVEGCMACGTTLQTKEERRVQSLAVVTNAYVSAAWWIHDIEPDLDFEVIVRNLYRYSGLWAERYKIYYFFNWFNWDMHLSQLPFNLSWIAWNGTYIKWSIGWKHRERLSLFGLFDSVHVSVHWILFSSPSPSTSKLEQDSDLQQSQSWQNNRKNKLLRLQMRVKVHQIFYSVYVRPQNIIFAYLSYRAHALGKSNFSIGRIATLLCPSVNLLCGPRRGKSQLYHWADTAMSTVLKKRDKSNVSIKRTEKP